LMCQSFVFFDVAIATGLGHTF